MSMSEFAKWLERKAGRKRHKFGAVRTDGFPSKLEAAVFQELCLREKAGEIRDLKRYATVDLGSSISWKLDFTFIDATSGERVWCEAKGKWNADAGLKLKLWRDHGPGKLEIYRGDHRRPVLVEVVVPKHGGTK